VYLFLFVLSVLVEGLLPPSENSVAVSSSSSSSSSSSNNNNNNNNNKKNRDTTNVEPEMYDYTSNNWSHWNSNVKLKEKFGSRTRKTFDRFTTKDSCTWNITHNTESTAV
jgi:hypothetical protein